MNAGSDASNDPERRPDAARVSVVIPTYARPTFLARAIRSVQRQTLHAWELAVVDDNEPTSDARSETRSVMATFDDDPRIRYVQHDENRGGGAARNTGIRASSAELVAFLDDDDEWFPERLEVSVTHMDAAPNDVVAAYCRPRIVDAEGREIAPRRPQAPSATLRDLLKRNTVGPTSCIICRRSALLEVGMFDERLPAKQDVDLYIRLIQIGPFSYIDRALFTFHRHDRPRIGKDLDGTVAAHHIFHEKYAALIDRYPEVVNHRLTALGSLLVASGRHREARPLLWRAWRHRPTNLRTVGELLLACGFPRSLARSIAAGASSRRGAASASSVTDEPT